MRLCLLCLPLLLTGCLGRETDVVIAPPRVPADLLQPAPGYSGPHPKTEGQLSDALVAEAEGRALANSRLEAIAKILNSTGPQ